jgi:hypothetical protein
LQASPSHHVAATTGFIVSWLAAQNPMRFEKTFKRTRDVNQAGSLSEQSQITLCHRLH